MSKVLSYVAVQYNTTATITSGQTQSAAVDLTNGVLVGIFIPSAFTGVALTFQVASSSTGTYVDMVDGAGNVVTKTVSTSQYLYIDPNIFAGVRYLKITSGTAEGGTRVLTLATRCIT